MSATITTPAPTTDIADALRWVPLAEAMAALGKRCDGARQDDGEGFSAGDVPLGHYLAGRPAAAYDEAEATAAWQLARKYRAQLERLGFDVDAMPAPARPDARVREMLTERRQEAAALAAFAAASFCYATTTDGKPVIVLGFPFDYDAVAQAQRIPGRTYRAHFDGRRRVNVFPGSSAPAVAAFCERHGITPAPEVARLAENPPARDLPPLGQVGANVTFDAHDTMILIRFDGFPTLAQRDAVKTLPGRAWDKNRKVWTAPNTAEVLAMLPAVAKAARLRLDARVAREASAATERARLRGAVA